MSRVPIDRHDSSAADGGFFGPGTELWRVLRERSVVMGGMRALLMHAAHPLVAAAAAETGMYELDTSRRHERTLHLTFTLVFGTRLEATAAARQINAAHRSIRGLDRVSGLTYSAKDHDLLLWVHSGLISSFLLFEKLTIGRLDDAGRQRFHEEAARMATLLGLPANRIPSTVADLDSWIGATIDSAILRPTPSSRLLAAVMQEKASGSAGYRSKAAGYMALHTLPPALRDLYGIHHNNSDERKLDLLARSIRIGRLALPPRARFIGPAIAAHGRLRGDAMSVTQAAALPRR